MTEVQPREIRDDLSIAARIILAALLLAAGGIHLAMVPSHWSESVVEGGGFAIVGWVQIGLGLLLIVRPSRIALRVVVLANVAFVGVWAISRAWGLPVGAHAGHPHDAGFVDLVCVGIEVATVVIAALVLLHPDWGRTWHGARLAVAAIISIAVLALATAALASPSARDHARGSHDGHTHDDAVTAAATDGHGHAHAAAAAPADDLGLSKLENGHQHGSGEVKLDHATQVALTAQLAQTMPLIEKYPTIAAAEAAGYRRAGRFNPGLGTHYTGGRGDGVITGVNGERMVPQLIYDGTDPDAPLAGFMYLANGPNGGPPEGFVGPNDHWHEHENLCIKFDAGRITALSSDGKMNQEKCSQLGGMYIQQSGFMIHVWTVPGYESSLGVFSGVNPKLTCPDGTYFKAPEGGGTADSTCKNLAPAAPAANATKAAAASNTRGR